MKVALAQVSDEKSFDKNLEKSLYYAELAGKMDVDVLCFPEMQFTKFFPSCCCERQVFQLGEGIPGPIVQLFQKKAKDYGMVIVLNFIERLIGEFYNSSPLINSNGKLMGVSRLVHTPQIEGYYAQTYFTPGCGDFLVYQTAKGRIGILISFDRHFPEASRALALQDAELVLIPGFLTNEQSISVYHAELQAMAYQNGYFVGMCNRVGKEGDISFIGRSLIVNPEGQIIAEASDEEGLLITEIDLDEVKRERLRSPYLKLRRPDEYYRIIRQT